MGSHKINGHGANNMKILDATATPDDARAAIIRLAEIIKETTGKPDGAQV
jgi:hypothetical protein